MNAYQLPNYEYRSKRVSVCKPLIEGEWNTLMDVEGPGIIKHIWVTFPLRDRMFGRRNILRIYWDDEETPSVEAPIADFFGVPMGFTGQELRIDSYFLSVVPQNGMNCYFTMPFQKRARVELLVNMLDMGYGFYFQADYEECEQELPEQWRSLRFHAQYRMESPTECHGHRYVALDAEGEGYVVGANFGIKRNEPQKDAWYHGGGDLVYIDGESNPGLIHGIGAEDYFGHSWGTETSSTLYVGNPLYERMTSDEMMHNFNSVLYRFYVHDPIRFRDSVTLMLGAMGDKISSVVYWYQKEPHREFFKLPHDGRLLQQEHMPRLTYDLLPEVRDEWNLYGPIRDESPYSFDAVHPLEVEPDLSVKSQYVVPNRENAVITVHWQRLTAIRGFVDFNVCMRPDMVRGIMFQTECYGLAFGYVDAAEAREVFLRVGFDDRIRVKVNGAIVLEAEHPNGFACRTVAVRLNQGRNMLNVKLSNQANTNYRAWVMNAAFVDEQGQRIHNLQIRSEV